MKTILKKTTLTLAALPLLALSLAAFGQAIYTPYTFTTLAGSAGLVGDANGAGSAARFYQPFGVAVDTNGTVYVVDSGNHTIRKVTPAGVVTMFAGLAGSSGSLNGTGAAARFYYPDALAVDKAGNVYVADTFNHTIRKITPAGVVTTLAGSAGLSGSANGTGSAARFWQPYGVTVDPNGTVYVGDTYNHTIRKVTPAGVVTTFAGTANSSGSTDGSVSAARFNQPEGLGVDTNGNLFVAEYNNATIRRVTPAGLVTTVAGLAGVSGNANGTGSAARFSGPDGLTVDRAGNVYVADSSNHTIQKGSPTLFVQFTASPNLGVVPLYVQFTCPATDSTGMAITHWNWTFGDGSTSTAQNPSHAYTTLGTYQPSLWVTNSNGQGVSATGPPVTAAAFLELVSNGGFESGNFSGWTLNGQAGQYNLVDTFNQSTEGMQPHAPSSYFARLGQSGSLGYLSQTLATTPGAKYLLSFWLNSPDGLTPNQFLVSWNGNQIFSANNLPRFGNNPAIAWSNLLFTVTATASATVLQFGFRDEPTALGLDDVSVVQISPALALQPQNQIVTCQSNATFTAIATGPTPLRYQWRKNGAPLAGATNTTYSVTPLTCQSPDDYSVVVANSNGSITSSVATLTVVDTHLPVIACPANMLVSTLPGQSSVVVNYAVTATDNCAVVSLSCNPASGSVFPMGTNLVTLAAVDCAGNSNTCSFTITVLSNVVIFPPDSIPYGKTYAEWSAEHWKWVYSMPVNHHPLFDTAGVSAGQSGDVWFLGGTFTTTSSNGVVVGNATRSATIPEGKALFFPVIDNECSTVEGNGTTDGDLRSCAQFFQDHARDLTCTVDGVAVSNLNSFRVQSPLFTFGPLPENNVLQFNGYAGATNGATSPAVSDGVFLMLAPLAAGSHTIHFGGALTLSVTNGDPFDFEFRLDITHHLTVVPSSGVFPTNAVMYDKTYPEWVAAFWKWGLEYPLDGHPFVEHPTFDLSLRQSGPVWFWGAPDLGERTCTMPAGTALFLTLRDVETSTLEDPPFFGATENDQRTNSAWFADHITNLFCVIDGVSFTNLPAYRTSSSQFQFNAPTPWIFGTTGGSGTGVGDGYYLMLAPLAEGPHTIHYGGAFRFAAGELGPDPQDWPKDITVHLTVTAPRLDLAWRNGHVVLSWVQTPNSYALETASALNPGDWSQSGAAVTALGGRNEVTLPVSNGGQFFRLRKQ